MKITERDLSESILNKLNQFDRVINTFDKNNPDGFISYNGTDFYIKRFNDANARRVYTEDELIGLHKDIFRKRLNVRSSFNHVLVNDKKRNNAIAGFLHEVNIKEISKTRDDIHKVKYYPESIILIYDTSGVIYKVKDSKIQYEVKILDFLKEHLVHEVDVFDILDIEYYDSNIYLSTLNSGIYVYRESTEKIELLSTVSSVKILDILENGELFCANDEECVVISTETGKKIDKYHQLHNHYQIPKLSLKVKGGLFILGQPIGLSNSESLLHYWKKDLAGVSYNNKDAILAKNPVDINYQPMFMKEYDGDLYISGLYNGKIFIWKYNIDYPHRLPEEIILDVPIRTFDSFEVLKEDIFLIGSRCRVYVIDKKNRYIDNIKLETLARGIKLLPDNSLYGSLENKLFKFDIETFEKKQDFIDIDIYSDDVSCNNIDILVDGARKEETLFFYDADTQQEIKPSYYMIYRDEAVIKLTNCKAKKIRLKMQVLADSNIRGISIKHNRIFLR